MIIKMRAHWGFFGGSDSKESACNSGDLGSIPELGRSPEKGNGYPLQYSCLENPIGRGAWRVTVHGVTKSDKTERLTHHTGVGWSQFSKAGVLIRRDAESHKREVAM